MRNELEVNYLVSEACQINDLDHDDEVCAVTYTVSEACQINDLDHVLTTEDFFFCVSEACQINDLDHLACLNKIIPTSFRSLSDQ